MIRFETVEVFTTQGIREAYQHLDSICLPGENVGMSLVGRRIAGFEIGPLQEFKMSGVRLSQRRPYFVDSRVDGPCETAELAEVVAGGRVLSHR